MTAYPLDAVSAAEPLCTHGKDKPGLGAPNSLKIIIIFIKIMMIVIIIIMIIIIIIIIII